jgi:transposase
MDSRPRTPTRDSPVDQESLRHQLSRSQRIRVHTLRDINWTYEQIAKQLDITQRQVQWAVNHPQTPSKRSGRPPALTDAQTKELVDLITSSRRARRLPYHKLIPELSFDCGVDTVRNTLRRKGYKRYIARREPAISEKNRADRLAWAIAH